MWRGDWVETPPGILEAQADKALMTIARSLKARKLCTCKALPREEQWYRNSTSFNAGGNQLASHDTIVDGKKLCMVRLERVINMAGILPRLIT